MGSPLPRPIWYHHSAVSFGRVWVWGGLYTKENNSATQDVYSAPILSSGKIGDWRKEQVVLPTPIYASSTSVAGPYLISFSPRMNGSVATNDVYWASATGWGLSQWDRIQTALPNRVYHAGATDYKRGIVYLSGGRESKQASSQVLNRVFLARLSGDAREAAYQGSATVAAAGSERIDIEQWEREASQAPAETPSAVSSAPDAARSNPLTLFKTFDQARYLHRPMVLYFHSNKAKSCRDQIADLNSEKFAALTNKAVFALVPVDTDPQFAQQMGVWRVPSWVFYSANGLEITRHDGTMKLDELAAKMSEAY